MTGVQVYTAPLGRDFGTEYYTQYVQNGLDAAIVGGQGHTGVTYTGWSWIEGVNTTTAQPIAYAQDVGAGINLYFSGSYGGQAQGITVGSPGCFWDDKGLYTCSVQEVSPVGTGSLCQGGDSGGPVYAPSSTPGKLIAIGIIKGGNGTDCFYTQISPILNSWSSTIATG